MPNHLAGESSPIFSSMSIIPSTGTPGERGPGAGSPRGQTHLPEHRLLRLPLVPRHGAGVFHPCTHRGTPQPDTSSASRWTERSAPTWTPSTWTPSRPSPAQEGGRSASGSRPTEPRSTEGPTSRIAPLRHALVPAGAAGHRGGMGRAPGRAGESAQRSCSTCARAAGARRQPRPEPQETAPRSHRSAACRDHPLHGRTLQTISASFDPVHGGWGGAPKFPQPVLIDYLLARQALEPDPAMWTQIEKTLDAMAAGRHLRPPGWRLPPLFHRRRMAGAPLREDALRQRPLARSYLHAWQLSGKERYRRVCEETLDYLLRDMRHAEGAFFSSEDADSEGEEGRFFVWTADEIDGSAAARRGGSAPQAYGVTAAGNFEGRNILHLVRAPEDAATAALLAPPGLSLYGAASTECGPAATTRSSPPGTAWPWRRSPRRRARSIPTDTYTRPWIAGAFLVDRLCGQVGGSRTLGRMAARTSGFSRRSRPGRHRAPGLYEATFDERWFVAARGLLDALPRALHCRRGWLLRHQFRSRDAHRTTPVSADTPLPSGNAAACMGLLKLAAYTGDSRNLELVEEALSSVWRAWPRGRRAPSRIG